MSQIECISRGSRGAPKDHIYDNKNPPARVGGFLNPFTYRCHKPSSRLAGLRTLQCRDFPEN